MRTSIVLLLSFVLTACITPADDHENVTFIRDAEPNSSTGEAQALGEPGLYAFQGACDASDTQDWFSGNTSGGVIEASLILRTEPPVPAEDWEPEVTDVPAVVNLQIKSASLAVLGEAEVTPSTPAEVAGPSELSGTVYVQVTCSDRSLWYSGIIRVP